MDIAEFDQWYRREHDRVVNSPYLISGSVDAACEATDEAFARAAQRWSRVRAMASPAGWTFRVALNALRREMRRRKREADAIGRLGADDAFIDRSPDPDLWDAARSRPRHYRVRRRAIASAVTACVVVGGIVAVAWATSGSNGVGGVHTLNSTAASTTSIPANPEADAKTHAAELLDRAPLPPGSQRYVGTLPTNLRQPFDSPSGFNVVDEHRLWIVNEPNDRVMAFLQRHTPQAMTQGCCGTLKHFDTVVVTMIQFDEHIGSHYSFTELQMEVARRTATTSWIRADAQVVWFPDRDPRERVDASDAVIVITRRPADPTKPSTRIVVTDHRTVARVEQAFNAVQTSALLSPHSCPQTPSYTLDFKATTTSRTDVEAKTGCGATSVTVGGRRYAPLASLESTVAPIFSP